VHGQPGLLSCVLKSLALDLWTLTVIMKHEGHFPCGQHHSYWTSSVGVSIESCLHFCTVSVPLFEYRRRNVNVWFLAQLDSLLTGGCFRLKQICTAFSFRRVCSGCLFDHFQSSFGLHTKAMLNALSCAHNFRQKILWNRVATWKVSWWHKAWIKIHFCISLFRTMTEQQRHWV